MCLKALYDSDLDGDDDEEEEEEDLEVHRLPDLLFRHPPQLLQYTAALLTPYELGHEGVQDQFQELQRDSAGELKLLSHTGTVDSLEAL